VGFQEIDIYMQCIGLNWPLYDMCVMCVCDVCVMCVWCVCDVCVMCVSTGFQEIDIHMIGCICTLVSRTLICLSTSIHCYLSIHLHTLVSTDGRQTARYLCGLQIFMWLIHVWLIHTSYLCWLQIYIYVYIQSIYTYPWLIHLWLIHTWPIHPIHIWNVIQTDSSQYRYQSQLTAGKLLDVCAGSEYMELLKTYHNGHGDDHVRLLAFGQICQKRPTYTKETWVRD